MFSKITKHWAMCRRFRTQADRFLYVYGRVLRRSRFPLPARKAVVKVHLKAHLHPFYLRVSSTDWLVLEEIFHQGEYSFVERHVSSAGLILDLGANAGFTVRYWHELYPDATIIAVEPDQDNCETCERNISAAALGRHVKLLRAAVGARSSQAKLMRCDGEWAYRVEEAATGDGPAVDVISIGRILHEHGNGRAIDLLKCDIEGAERELFANCRDWIGRVKSIVVELHPPYQVSHLLTDLYRAGGIFDVVEVSTKKACPVALLRTVPDKASVTASARRGAGNTGLICRTLNS